MIWTIIFFIIAYGIFSFAINFHKAKKLRELEGQFIIASLSFHQMKYHIYQVLELVYDKAGEIDPKFVEDYDKIKKAVDKRLNKIGDEWIESLQKTLGYKLNYNNWEELINKAEPLLLMYKRNEAQRRNKENSK